MIKTIQFIDLRGYSNIERDDCIVLKSTDKGEHIVMAFPFHEDTPNFVLNQSEAYTFGNALLDLAGVKFLPGDTLPRSELRFVADLVESLIGEYPLINGFDTGARQALTRVAAAINSRIRMGGK